MKIQILVDGQVVNTQVIVEALHEGATHLDFKRLALQAALGEDAIRISDSLRATFKVFDVNGNEIGDPIAPSRYVGG